MSSCGRQEVERHPFLTSGMGKMCGSLHLLAASHLESGGSARIIQRIGRWVGSKSGGRECALLLQKFVHDFSTLRPLTAESRVHFQSYMLLGENCFETPALPFQSNFTNAAYSFISLLPTLYILSSWQWSLPQLSTRLAICCHVIFGRFHKTIVVVEKQ
jgi:hypothetical protein